MTQTVQKYIHNNLLKGYLKLILLSYICDKNFREHIILD